MLNRLNYNIRVYEYAFILALLVSPSIIKSTELKCDIYNIKKFVFSRVSPIQTSASEDMEFKKSITVKYGFAYPVIQQKKRTLKICIEGKKHWVKKSHVAITNSPEWVSTSSISLDMRPKLTLWRSRERLSTYLAQENASEAPSDYTESSTGEKYAEPLKLAVDKSDVMEMNVKDKQVDVANLLIPFPLSALGKYKKIQLDKDKDKDIRAIFIVDASASTEGFVTSFLINLSRHWDKASLLPLKNILLLSFDSDAYVSKPKLVSSSEFSNIAIEERDVKVVGQESKGLSEAILTAANEIHSQKYKPPLIILAGGDVTLSLSRYLNGFSEIELVKITPEIQRNLKNSLSTVSRANFIEFQPNSAHLLLQKIISIRDNYDNGRNSLNYEDISQEFGKQAMLPLLPTDLSQKNLATPPAYATKESDWFAINLWTVVNEELLKFTSSRQAK